MAHQKGSLLRKDSLSFGVGEWKGKEDPSDASSLDNQSLLFKQAGFGIGKKGRMASL